MLFRGQDGVTGTRFTRLPETTENNKKTLDTRMWRTVIPKRWEANEESNTWSALIALREFSRHDARCSADPGRALRTSWVELMGLGVQRDQRQSVHRAMYWRGESCMEIELQRPAESSLCTQQSTDELLPAGKLPEGGRGTIQRDSGEHCQALTQARKRASSLVIHHSWRIHSSLVENRVEYLEEFYLGGIN